MYRREKRKVKLWWHITVCILQGSTFLPNTTYSVEPANFETTLLLVERFDENTFIDLQNIPNVATITIKDQFLTTKYVTTF